MCYQHVTTRAYPAKSASAFPVGAPRGRRRRTPPPSTPCFRRSLDLLFRASSPSSPVICFYPSHLRSTQSLTHLIHAANASLTVNSHRDDVAPSLSLMDADISRCGSSLLPSFHLVGTKSSPAVRRVAARDRQSARCLDSSPRTDGRWKPRRLPRPTERERSSARPSAPQTRSRVGFSEKRGRFEM